MKTILFALSAIAATATLPAAAEPREPAKPAAEMTAAVPAPAVRSAATRYCIKDTTPESRIPKKLCHTRTEWSDRGVEIPADK